MKTTITIANGEIHLSVINNDSKKRDDIKFKYEPKDLEHPLVLQKYNKQINHDLIILSHITL